MGKLYLAFKKNCRCLFRRVVFPKQTADLRAKIGQVRYPTSPVYVYNKIAWNHPYTRRGSFVQH